MRFFVVVLAMVLSACETFPDLARPEIQEVRPRITGVDFQGVDLAFDLNVANPWPIPIRAPKFQYALAVQDSPLLSQTVGSGVNIPASGTGTASLPVRLSFMDLFRTVQSLSGQNQATYQLTGALLPSVAGQEFNLPFTHAGNFPIVRPPSISIVDLKTSGASMGGMALDITADIGNPNIFDVGIDALSYALQLGGAQLGTVAASTGGTVGAGQSGRVHLTAQASGMSALQGLLGGAGKDRLSLVPMGAIQTPYGPIRLNSATFNASR